MGIILVLKRFAEWIKKLFSNKGLESTEQTYWVNHICDEYVNASQKSVGMYANVHGFEGLNDDGSWTYWVGIDTRFIGIRVADIVIRCKNKSTYDRWIYQATHDLNSMPQAVRDDPNLWCRDGDCVEIDFMFRWGNEDKHFNVRFGTDRYAEEK